MRKNARYFSNRGELISPRYLTTILYMKEKKPEQDGINRTGWLFPSACPYLDKPKEGAAAHQTGARSRRSVRKNPLRLRIRSNPESWDPLATPPPSPRQERVMAGACCGQRVVNGDEKTRTGMAAIVPADFWLLLWQSHLVTPTTAAHERRWR